MIAFSYIKMGDKMRLSELQNKKVVNVHDGSYIGDLIDVNISNERVLESLIVEKSKFLISRFTTKDEILIKWNKIEKIGEDVILTSI